MSFRYLLICIVLTLTMESALAILGRVVDVFGKRTLFEKRLERKYVDFTGPLAQHTRLRQTYYGDNRNKITRIKVTSNKILSKGIKVKVINGGIGEKSVTLEFYAPRPKGVSLTVTLYGKFSWT